MNSGSVGQCTWYAYGRIQEVGLINSSQLASWPNRNGGSGIFLNDPSTWIADANAAHAAGYPISTGSTPQVGALAVWNTGGADHVAFVQGVSGSTIQVTECNFTPTSNNTAPYSSHVVVAGATYLHSSMDTSTSSREWLMPEFTEMTVVSGPSAVVNGYQWIELTGNGYTGYAAWTQDGSNSPAVLNQL